MASIHPIHHPDPAYAPPEVHIPYPVEAGNYPPYLNNPDDDPDHESLTGETKADATEPNEWAIPEATFADLVLGDIGIGPNVNRELHKALQEQERERASVLLPIPRSAAEEKELHEKVMASLRNRVAALEEEELFESSMKKFTQRSSITTETNGSMVTAASNPAVVGESNAAGLGDQPRSSDVKDLLRADIQGIWARERERAGGT